MWSSDLVLQLEMGNSQNRIVVLFGYFEIWIAYEIVKRIFCRFSHNFSTRHNPKQAHCCNNNLENWKKGLRWSVSRNIYPFSWLSNENYKTFVWNWLNRFKISIPLIHRISIEKTDVYRRRMLLISYHFSISGFKKPMHLYNCTAHSTSLYFVSYRNPLKFLKQSNAESQLQYLYRSL